MKLKKALITFFVMLIMFTSVSGLQVKAAAKDETKAIVKQAFNEYARSIAQSNSATNTVVDMLQFSMFHPGEHYKANEKDPLVATIFNSEVAEHIICNGIATAIEDMNVFGMDRLYAYGGLNWYDGSYSGSMYSFEKPFTTMTDRLRLLTSTSAAKYSVGINNNDRALVLVVGSSSAYFDIEKVEIKEETAVYDVSVKVKDSFDFNGTYENAKRDMTFAKLLTGIGKNSLNAFTWEANGKFQVEVPYTCDHKQGNYQWTLDADTKKLEASQGEGFTKNDAAQISSKNSAGKTVSYHVLEEPVKLYHDKPWVIEYSGKKISSMYLCATDTLPTEKMYYSHSSYLTSFRRYEVRTLTKEEKELLKENPKANVVKTIHHYNGMVNTELYNKYYSKYELTYRLENKVASDGTNMVYLSMWATNKDGEKQQILEATPMDLYSHQKSTEKKRSDFVEGNAWHQGQDMIIGTIGYKSAPLTAQSLKLTIWTNGESGEETSSYQEEFIKGNCLTPDVVADICTDCHHTIVKHTEPGDHVFSSYKSDNNATCTKDGTKTAVCKYCGTKKTVVVENSALGHKAKKVKDCRATCTLSGYVGGQVCTRCDKVLVENTFIPAKGHSYADWVVKKKATCVSEGLQRRDCNVCNHYEEAVIEKTEHTWSETYTVDKPANYEEEGLMAIRCSVCNEENGNFVIKKLGSASCEKVMSYTGKKCVPNVTVKNIDGEVLEEGTDYTYVVRNTNNAIVKEPIAVGNYVIHITYIGKYSGEDRLEYSVAPSVPKNVKVKLTAHDDVKVSWNKVKYANGYLVYYKKSTAKKYTLYGTVSDTSVTIKNLADNATYNFKVIPYGTSNGKRVEGKSSSAVTIKTLRNLAAPKNLTLELTAHDDIKVSWKKVSNAKGYYVYYKKSTASKYTSYKVTTKTSITLKNLADNTKYNIKVVPYGVSGSTKVKSDRYAVKSIQTLRNLKAPSSLKLKATGNTILKATWSKTSYAKGYYVYYKEAGTDTYKLYTTTTKTNVSIKGLKKNKKYTVKVVPYGISNTLKVQSDNYSVKSLKTLNKK